MRARVEERVRNNSLYLVEKAEGWGRGWLFFHGALTSINQGILVSPFVPPCHLPSKGSLRYGCHDLHYTKVNSKWIKDLNVRPEKVKLLEENIGRTLDDINQSKIVYDPPPRVMEIKTKVNKSDIKLERGWEDLGEWH